MYCPSCGSKVGDSVRYCASCGAAVGVSSDQPTPPQPFSPPPDPNPTRRGVMLSDISAWVRRHKVWTAVIAFVILAVIVGAVSGGGSSSSTAGAAPPASPPASSAPVGGTTPPPSTTTPPSKPYKPRVKLTGIVHGQLEKDGIGLAVAGADGQAVKDLSWSNVYCGWDDQAGHVTLHVEFHNKLGAHVQVEVEPRYTIRDGGTHGNSVDSFGTVGIAAHGYRVWLDNAGVPAGVPQNAPIGRCAPLLENDGPG